MNKLSPRIQHIIDTLVERVSSMEETAEVCVVYTNLIAELFTLFNTVVRMEINAPDNYAYFKKTNLLVENLETQLKILPTVSITIISSE